MIQFTRYYGQFNDLRGGMGRLPQWARVIVAIFAVPGILLLSLSLLAVVVSILALLLLTVPVYSALKSVTGLFGSSGTADIAPESPGAKRVESTVVE